MQCFEHKKNTLTHNIHRDMEKSGMKTRRSKEKRKKTHKTHSIIQSKRKERKTHKQKKNYMRERNMRNINISPYELYTQKTVEIQFCGVRINDKNVIQCFKLLNIF